MNSHKPSKGKPRPFRAKAELNGVIHAGIRRKAKSGLRSFIHKFEPGVADSDADAIAAVLRGQGFDVKATHAWADNRDHCNAQLEISWLDAARDA